MTLDHVTFQGPPLDDEPLLAELPGDLAGLLRQINGFIQYEGGFHLRGACLAPGWHSLRSAWRGEESLHSAYLAVEEQDIPFAEDCVGDQFLLRQGLVCRLSGETGELQPLNQGLMAFLESAARDPVGFLGLHPLLQLQKEGGRLEPGQLLSVYPPFCTREASGGVSLKAVPSADRRRFLAGFAAQLQGLPEGGEVKGP